MDYRDALRKQIQLYYEDIIPQYHVTTVAGMKAAKKLRLFKKVDFKGYIAEFQDYKERALKLESMDLRVPAEDVETKLLEKDFRNSLLSFVMLCDANIAFYDMNERKQYRNGGVNVHDYAEVVNEMQKALAEAVMDLDFLDKAYKEYCADNPAE